MRAIKSYLAGRNAIRGIWGFCCAALFVLASHHAVWAGPTRRDLSVGVGVHFWNASRPEIGRELELAAKAGFSVIRWDVPWKAVETSPGTLKIPQNWDYAVDTANQMGIASLLILDYGNPLYDGGDKPVTSRAIEGFVRYALYVAKHFRGRVHHVEVWNEWDATTGATTPGMPEDYMRLLASVYVSLKRADSNLIVLGGGTSSITYSSIMGIHVGYGSAREGFFDKLLQLGLLDHVDGVSIHPYVFSLAGCMGTGAGFNEALSRIESSIQHVNPSKSVPVFVTEVGWPVGMWNGNMITDDKQASYLANAVQLAYRKRDISALFIYQLKDPMIDPSNKEDNFGLVGAEGRLKAAFNIMGQVNRGAEPKSWSSNGHTECSR